MATNINYNVVDFRRFGYPECYISIIMSTILFTSLYMVIYYVLMPKMVHPYFKHIQSNIKLHWNIVATAISAMHSICILSLLCFLCSDILSFSLTSELVAARTTYKERLIVSISIGYFIYDFITWCIIYSIIHTKKMDYVHMVHHGISIIGLSTCIISVYGGKLGIIALFFSEITNPLLNINNIKNYFLNGTIWNSKSALFIDFTVKLFYIILFTVFRFVILVYLQYQAVFIYPCNIYIEILAVALLPLSVVLIPGLLKDLSKTYAKYKHAQNIQYSPVDQEASTTANEQTEEDDPERIIQRTAEQYDEVLLLSKKSVMHFFVAGTVYSFFHTNRMSVYVLYADELNATSLQIALLLYAACFWNGIASLLYGSLANQFGYDRLLVFLLVLQCIAVFLESAAQSFYVLLCGIVLGQVSITYIVFGYIAWILPKKHATAYTSYFYATFVISYLIGPSSAGFVSYYVSNRTVFIVNFVVCVCALCHSLIFISRTQKKLEQKQLMVELMEEKDDNEQFPICLDRLKDGNEEELVSEIDNKWYSIPKLSFYEWFMLISILYINASVVIAENGFIVYYTVYIIEDLKGNIIIGTCGVVLVSLLFMIGNILIPKLFDSENENNSKWWNNKYIVIIISLLVLISQTAFFWPYTKSLNIYWVYDITGGFALGLLSMTSEYILLEIQPTKESGKISGAKGLLRNWLIGVSLLIVSICWEMDHNSFFYVISVSFSIALLCTMAMMYAKYKHSQTTNNQMNETDLQ